MIVGRETLDVLPVTDEVLRQAGEYVSDVDFRDVSWSNELVLHVIEIKTGGPAPRLEPLPDCFLSGACRRSTSCFCRSADGSCLRRCIRGWIRFARCGLAPRVQPGL